MKSTYCYLPLRSEEMFALKTALINSPAKLRASLRQNQNSTHPIISKYLFFHKTAVFNYHNATHRKHQSTQDRLYFVYSYNSNMYINSLKRFLDKQKFLLLKAFKTSAIPFTL